MSSETIIRKYESEDYNSVRAKLKTAGLFYKPMDSHEMYTRLLEDGNVIFVAERNGQIIGNILVLKSWGPFLFRLVVDAQFHGQGIGSQLLREGEKFIKQFGNSEVHILVDENDTHLQEFYRQRGYDQGGVYRWMTKDLSNFE